MVSVVATLLTTKLACAVAVLLPLPTGMHPVVRLVPLAAFDQLVNRKPAGSAGMVSLKKFALPRPRLALVLPVIVMSFGKFWPCPPATVLQAESEYPV